MHTYFNRVYNLNCILEYVALTSHVVGKDYTIIDSVFK